MPKRGLDVMIICITLMSGLFSIFPGLNVTITFWASSGIVNRKRSEQYVEIYREIDTSTTKKSGRITFACIVNRDNLWIVTGQSIMGVWETVMQSASVRKSHVHLDHLQNTSTSSRLNSMLGKLTNKDLSGRRTPGGVAECLDADAYPGWFPGNRGWSLV